MSDVWPALPIAIEVRGIKSPWLDTDNISSALKLHDRVCKIDMMGIPNSLLTEFVAMRDPFPALTFLGLAAYDENQPVLPDSFLVGSAPRLRVLSLQNIPFPALGKLLLTTSDLVQLRLWRIPHSGYISPEAMATALSALTNLQEFVLHFQSPRSQTDRESRRMLPSTRVVLPALTNFRFKGDSEYLEDVVSRIDAPLLDNSHITLFNQALFHTPLLHHFISRTETFEAPRRANIYISSKGIYGALSQRSGMGDHDMLRLGILCKPMDWQISSLTQVYNSSLSPLPTLEYLGISEARYSQPQWQDDLESSQWLELLHPFTSVRNLELSKNLVRLIAPALGELDGERVAEVLPALQNIFVQGPPLVGHVQEAIEQFIAARQLSGRPITVHQG
jgi:hypothetical protein